MSTTAPEIAPKRPLAGILLFMLASAVVVGMALLSRFHGFKIFDDAYMFLRYTDHLLAGHGLVWNVGQGPAYGATSLAYVLALAPFRLAFPDNAAAALFSCSFFWGLVFLGLLFRLGIKAMRPPAGFKPYVAGFLFLSLTAAAVTLRTHFASGMETTLAMSYVCLCLLLWEGLRQGRGNAWWIGVVGGISWWIRPDLLVFTWGVPAVMWALGKDLQRWAWLRILLVTLAVTGLAALGARLLTGSWLPLSFYAKSTGLYGPEFAATYRLIPFSEGARFMARTWPALLLLGMGVYVKARRWRSGYSALDKALLLTVLVYAAYFSFLALQVMGFGQRFYYPLLPPLLYLGMRELLELPQNLRLGPGLEFKRIPTHLERGGILVVGALLLYYGIDHGRMLKQSQSAHRFAVFSVLATYRADLYDYWPKLDALAHLPDDLEIATTEVGMPAALYPHRNILDLAALNHPRLMEDGLTAQAVLTHCAADLVYLPHENYVRLHAALAASTAFAERYTVFSAKDVHAAMGVAIRKDSPYATRLREIFGW